MSVASEDTPLSRSLGGLDPESRALLDLSLRHGVPDAEIARLLGIDESEVARRRSAVLERLASEIGVAGRGSHRRLQDELRDELGSREQRDGARAAAPPAGPATPIAPSGRATAGPRARGAGVAAVLLTLIAAGVLLSIALASGGSREERDAPLAGRAAMPPTLALTPLGGRSGSASGTARIARSGTSARLELSLRGLPRRRGSLQVWLYSSQIDARPLARVRSGASTVGVALPSGFERFRFVDVSAEPADGNDNHSGESLLRAPIDALPTSP